jgi:hypothetical protein
LDYCNHRRRHRWLARQQGYEPRRINGHFLECIVGSVQQFSLTGLIVAFVGAIVVLGILNLVQRGRVR